MTDTITPDLTDSVDLKGFVEWVLTDEHGNVKESGVATNVITSVGDQMYAERGVGIVTVPIPTGMKLGTQATPAAPAKTGVNSTLQAYLAGAFAAFNPAVPVSVSQTNSRRITFTAQFGAGVGTSAVPITEAVIVNETPLTTATPTQANTISRFILSPAVGSKGSNDTLTLTWHHDLGSAAV